MELVLKRYKILKKSFNNNLKILWIILMGLILFFSFIISINLGEYRIGIKDLISANLSEQDYYIFYNIRVLRSLTAIISGMGLGIAGAIVQNILKNPLASPFTLGLSNGAAFGASFVIIFLNSGSYLSTLSLAPYLTIIGAFTGAIIAMSIISFVSFVKNADSKVVILTGVAVGTFFHSMTMLLQYFATDTKAASSLFWSFGDVSKGSYPYLLLTGLVVFFSLLWFIFHSWDFNALLWGSDISLTLGVNVKKLKIVSIILISLITSIITSFLGVIGFVGLIAPHIAFIFSGNDNRFLIPLSAIMGGIVLNVSDIISRVLLPPAVIPVGIITSFWGIIVLVYIIMENENVRS